MENEKNGKILKWTEPSLKKISDYKWSARSADCAAGSGAETCTTVGAVPASGNCTSGEGAIHDCATGGGAACSSGVGA